MADQHEDANRAVWTVESGPVQPTAPLARGLTTDVAIVGGGFTGVSTALHLRRARPALGIALLEAGVLGQGASGRNGGQVLHWINGVSPKTPDALRRIHAVTGADMADLYGQVQGVIPIHVQPHGNEHGHEHGHDHGHEHDHHPQEHAHP